MTERTALEHLTVGQVAQEFAVTVRTLHHYDEVGLLRPSERSGAGYRLYTAADLTRLQHVVVYRRLGFTLEEIGVLLAHPEGVQGHLRRQRAAVESRLEEMRDLVTALDHALEKEETGMKLTREEQQDLFGDGYSEEYAAEAEQRWGDSDAWKQSRRRTSAYTAQDWAEITAEQASVTAALADSKRTGRPADSPEAMAAAEQHRLLIHRRFYDLTPELHRSLGDLYVSDPRFTRTYEEVEPGLAQYVREAIHANAGRQSD